MDGALEEIGTPPPLPAEQQKTVKARVECNSYSLCCAARSRIERVQKDNIVVYHSPDKISPCYLNLVEIIRWPLFLYNHLRTVGGIVERHVKCTQSRIILTESAAPSGKQTVGCTLP